MNLAPVGLVVYNRIEHTKRVIEALKKNTLAIYQPPKLMLRHNRLEKV